LINFNYALDCNTTVELAGSDASVHYYILGGTNLNINLGTWTPKSHCGGPISSNLKYFDKTLQNWFKYDRISQQLHVFGFPKFFGKDHFEFIFEALQYEKVIATSVYRIKFVKKSSDLAL
jgi:hypothetical protein